MGPEQSGRRPFVVVASAGYLQQVTQLVLAVPVTQTDRQWPNHIALEGPTGLGPRCFAMTEQVRAISHQRIVKVTGIVDGTTLDRIAQCLSDFLII
ncbi:MAG: type II toxin-antitoxin system PemK/MazF family toxin [Micrococcales bacterium]|nr:type II toxin-antitoxin system PemK/MazF family toxin [Micrococcales bacterium]